ncbi:stage II sporulation protein SpoIID [Paenibacillus sp. FSL H8-0548]|uniref:SpoIID/LytB domain-containing protein n=1 Tax=Paenibacillus sp. FSL H8-0548 TaxID=1920422 RepID=UPI00096F1127|nr:SpoIID/LytB domain-containing protein [Paenibacillus sp. FSL H8-0548]OMF31690.1 stage II sporulation protein SpoIID [Paenibacillus sp. FSL H8-0548]
MAIKISIKRYMILATAILLLASVWTGSPSQAAVPKLDNIRVALFMQLPGKYEETTAVATFSSATGMSIGERQPSGINNWFNVEGAASARFALDSYKVKLFESSNFTTAAAVYNRLKALKGTAFLTSISKSGAIIYQVTEGTYKTAAEATAAQTKWNGDSELTKLIGSFKAVLQGPHYLETGPLPSKDAAIAAASGYGAIGLDAYVAVRSGQGGAGSYSVMVGATATEAELQIVKAAAAKAGGGSLIEANAQAAYLLIRNDHSVSVKAESSSELYLYAGGDAKITVSAAGAEPIKLTERSNRSYRGLFELSALNGRMAVINELPFEQYLYSVVGIEMYASWPAEALKAQAVAARSYALNKGFGYQIAHVVDTTLSQAYYGVGSEYPSTIAAVDATAGEVALYNGKVIEALFSASSGGMTADAVEIWKNSIPYLQAVKSPDISSETGLRSWYRVVLPSGAIGYIREDSLDETGETTAAGSRIMRVNANGTKVRKQPQIQDTIPMIATADNGLQVVVLEKTIESNAMTWTRGPYTAQEMLNVINAKAKTKITAPLKSLEVSQRGASGRATEILANGQLVSVSAPDSFRGTLGVDGSLPSTLFQIDETAKVTVLGAGSATRSKPADSSPIYTIGAGGKVSEAANTNLFILDGNNQVRAATKEPTFRFVGSGNGHGVGLSQYGALSLAQQGYDYQYILKYYYKDVIIAKE